MKTYNQKHALGLDISDGSLEVADVVEERGNLILKDFGRIELAHHTIVHGLIADTRGLSHLFKRLLTQMQIEPQRISFISALPDAQVIVKHIALEHQKHLTHAQLGRVSQQALPKCGIQLSDPVIRWSYVPVAPDQWLLTIYATEKRYGHQWCDFLTRHGMRLITLEMESLALSRALLHRSQPHHAAVIIDFGYRTTSVSIFNKLGLQISKTVERGGYHFTTLLASMLHCSYQEAEAMKMRHGLRKAVADAPSNMLKSKIEELITDLQLAKYIPAYGISRVITTGGGARMPGLTSYLQKKLNIPVSPGIIALDRTYEKNFRVSYPSLSEQERTMYAGAIGLALRGIDRTTIARGINFLR